MIYDEHYNGPTDPEERRLWKTQMYALHYGSSPEQMRTYFEEAEAEIRRRHIHRRNRDILITVLTLLTLGLVVALWRLGGV